MDIKNLTAVIFDKDGLMMDTEAPVFDVWREVFSEWGLPELTKELYGCYMGRDRRDNIRRISESYPGVDGEALYAACGERRIALFERHPIRTMPGLFELLDVLDARGIKKVVATSSSGENAKMTLEKCGVLHRMDAVISGETVKQSKPAPDIFLAAAKAADAVPERCLVLEDSAAGVIAAHAAGIPVIVVPDMIDPPAEITALCERKCRDLSEVARLFL